jgi:hypothetical protein
MKSFMSCLIVALLACSPSDPATLADNRDDSQTVIENNVEYSAETLIMESFPVQVRTNVQLSNRGSSNQTVTFPDGCVVILRVYSDAARTQLVYESRRDFMCTMATVPIEIAAGSQREVSSPSISAAQILGSSLPNGRYHFSALIRPDGKQLLIPAGSADLAK